MNRNNYWIFLLLIAGFGLVGGLAISRPPADPVLQAERYEPTEQDVLAIRRIVTSEEGQRLAADKDDSYENMCRACWLPNGSVFCGRSCDATGKTIYVPRGETHEKCGLCGDGGKFKK